MDEAQPKKIRVENLGRIVEAEVEVHPLTLLMGENNSGKTYLSMLLWWLHSELFLNDDDIRFFSDFFHYFDEYIEYASGREIEVNLINGLLTSGEIKTFFEFSDINKKNLMIAFNDYTSKNLYKKTNNLNIYFEISDFNLIVSAHGGRYIYLVENDLFLSSIKKYDYSAFQ